MRTTILVALALIGTSTFLAAGPSASAAEIIVGPNAPHCISDGHGSECVGVLANGCLVYESNDNFGGPGQRTQCWTVS